jgi:hypothetical protein
MHKSCEELAETGFMVYVEKSLPDPDRNGYTLRPDMIAIKNGVALVLDASAIYETSSAAFLNAYNTKVEKYKPIISVIKRFKMFILSWASLHMVSN